MRELEHLLQRDVGQKHVVRAIDRDAVRHQERVGAPRTNQPAVLLIDLEDRRILQQLGGGRVEAAARAMEDEHVTVGIDGDAGGFAHLNSRRANVASLSPLRNPRRRCGRSRHEGPHSRAIRAMAAAPATNREVRLRMRPIMRESRTPWRDS